MIPRVKKLIKPLITLVVALALIIGGILAGKHLQENTFVQEILAHYGYAGIFVISLISGFNFLVPIPAVSFLPIFTVAGMNPGIAVAIITIGVTFADSLGYLIGRAGHKIVLSIQEEHMVNRFQRMREQYSFLPIVTLFLYASFVPFPNEVLVLPLAFLGYRFRQLAPTLLLGNAVFTTLAAFGILNIATLF